MPRYYLHLIGGAVPEMDAHGIELASDQDAATEVATAVRDLRAEFSGDDWTGWTLHVVDASGRCVLDLPLEPPEAQLRALH
jgi:hypothetical protein